MARYRVQGPDGQIHVFEGPDDATPAQVEEFASKTFSSQAKPAAPAPAPQPTADQPGMLASIGAGLGKGVGSTALGLQHYIGKGIEALGGVAAPAPNLSSLITGQQPQNIVQRAGSWLVNDAATGRKKLEGELAPYKAANPISAGTGEIGGEIAATLPVGGLIAKPLFAASKAAPALAPLADAVATGGMRAGGVTGKAGMGVRMLGGAATGGVSSELVNPGDASGVVVGAAAPPVLAGLGKAGQFVGSAIKGAMQKPQAKSGADLIRALDLQSPAAVQQAVQQLRQAGELVPGSRPTLAQALQSPQAGILERVVHDSSGGAALRDQLAAQNAARMAALEGVAPTAPGGYQAARQDMGEAIARHAIPANQAAKGATRAAYESVPQNEAAFYLPDMAPVREEFFPRGYYGPTSGVDDALRTAQEIGTEQVPGIVAARASSGAPKTLAQAVRSAGGLNLARHDGRGAELLDLRGDLKNLVFNQSGMTPARMAQKMHEAGYIADDSADTLLQALKTDARGGPQYSIGDLPEQQWAAARDASMGSAPGAEAIPRKVTLGEFDALRQSIGIDQRAAAMDPKRAKEAAALTRMKQMLDDRVNEVVRGDGKADEVLPIAWADALDQARKLKLEQVQRFMTGPQAAIFRTGADGQPLAQGGEIAAKFWGNRPGVAHDVESFRRLIADNPALLGQFRSMITTEGAATAGVDGKLAGKFAKWVDAMQPGIKKAFDPEQVDMLQRIAQDIRRANTAADAGMARRSDTFQKAQNALDLGLLDNPMVSVAANQIPVLNMATGPAVSWLRDTARTAKARRLSGVLADSGAAADALELAGFRSPSAAQKMLANPALQSLFYRGLPPALSSSGGQ